MNRLRRGPANVALILTLALAAPTVALADGTPTPPPPPYPSCTGAGCQPAQDPATAQTATTGLDGTQSENTGQADYVLYALLLLLVISVPVAAAWQRTVREKALANDEAHDVAPTPPWRT